MTEVQQNGGSLNEELRELVSDAEALLRAGASTESGPARERIQATLQELRGRLAALEEQVSTRAREVDTYVRDNPWQAVAVAGGVALILGLIMGRRG
jgi:ElaB/YqjD/DUF883 family membrane-anchored ribosome-binding protein